MTAHRHTTPDVDAAQYLPTATEPLTFSDRPEWLEDAIEVRRIVVRPQADDELPALALQAHRQVELVSPGDWVVRDRWGHVYSLTAEMFARDFEPFPEPTEAGGAPTTTPAPAVTAEAKA